MSDEPKKRDGRVFNLKTGEVRSTDVPNIRNDQKDHANEDVAPGPALPPMGNADPGSSAVTPETPEGRIEAGEATEVIASITASGLARTAENARAGEQSIGSAPKGRPAGKAPKGDIETLEQFIEYAYGRKGQRISLKPKAQRQVAKNPRLDDSAVVRLLQLAATDKVLAVPRQLLLFAREINGFPELRASITSFVQQVIQEHPAFYDKAIQAAIFNLPEGPSLPAALERLNNLVIPAISDSKPLKESDLQNLRRNACQLFATWVATHRGFNTEELVALLFDGLWFPATRKLPDDTERFHALTEIEQIAGVGLACHRFRQQANEARAEKEVAQRLQLESESRVSSLETACAQLAEHRNQLLTELESLRESKEVEIAELRRKHAIESTHARHRLEQLQGRIVNRLSESIEMLQVGLTAIHRDPPRLTVMVERAEHVVDELRKEIVKLEETGHGGSGI